MMKLERIIAEIEKTKDTISKQQARLRELEAQKNALNEQTAENKAKQDDVSKEFEETFKDTPNMNPKYSPASLIRLLFTRFIDCDKLIYLDADTMTCSSLEAFKEINIEDKRNGRLLRLFR